MGKRKDLTNQTFGHLTALYRLPSRNGKSYWHCRCDCGNEIDVYINSLISGKTKSFGCARAGEDLTGRQFGLWTVIGRSNRTINGRHRFWTCQCECGTVKDVTIDSLKRGQSHSCGCLPRGGNHKDFTGEKRGGLTALRPTGKIIGNSPEYIWRCECGNEVTLPVSAVPRLGNRKCPDCYKTLKRDQTVDMRQRLERVAIHDLAPKSLRNLEQGKFQSNNTSGVRGVYERRKRWIATGYNNGKRVHLGTFDTMEEAKEARENFIQKQYGDAFRVLEKREGGEDGE